MNIKKVKEHLEEICGMYNPTFHFKTKEDLSLFLETNNFKSWESKYEDEGHTYIQNDIIQAWYFKKNTTHSRDLKTKYILGSSIKNSKLNNAFLKLVPGTYLWIRIKGLTLDEKQLFLVTYMKIVLNMDAPNYSVHTSSNKMDFTIYL